MAATSSRRAATSYALLHTHETPPCVGISLVAYEEHNWIDALLRNALAFSSETTRVVLHLNRASAYANSTMAAWETKRVSLNPHRIRVSRETGSILWAHVLNSVHLSNRWPACKHVVLQASNMLWLRSGMEATVLSKTYSIGRRWRSFKTEVERHSQNELFRALTEGGRHPFAYHEGSFYPVAAMLSFREFVLGFLRQKSNATLSSALLNVGSYPEESWLQGFVVNRFEPFRSEWLNGTRNHSSQLCWRVRAHLAHTPPDVVEAVGCGRQPSLFATKLVRGLADSVTRAVTTLDARAFGPSNSRCAPTASAWNETDLPNASVLLELWDPDAVVQSTSRE
jgi:hypothetical protein